MVLNIRNPEADALARELASIEGTEITQAVITALREAVEKRKKKEGAIESAQRILREMGIKPSKTAKKKLPENVWRKLHENY
jgi:antitoxin VapB